jgi:hypothetical protein
MAKVTGALLSMRAAGQIGKALVMGSWRGVSYARVHVTPANPQTTSQTLRRSVFSNIQDFFKRAGTLSRAPWDAAAVGRPLLGRNLITRANTKALKDQADMTDWIGSPGANGGLAGLVLTLDVATPGHMTATLTTPPEPTDWTLESAIFSVQEQRAPDALATSAPEEAEDATATADGSGENDFTLAAGTYVCSAWLKWTKPDGTTAYGASLTEVGIVT